MSSEDHQQLEEFLKLLELETRNIVSDPRLVRQEFQYLQEVAISKWERASAVIIYVRQEEIPAIFQNKSKTTLDDLKAHGLVGDDLTFKLDVITRARDILRNFRGREVLRTRSLNLFRKAARRLLELLDVVLSSLASVVPALNPVAELKETIEGMLHD